jgi:hypothetical protein
MNKGALSLCLGLAFAAHAVERWAVLEVSLSGPASGNPYLEVSCSALFSQGDQRITVPGFGDGGGTYKVRLSPPTTGEWRCRASTS